MFNISSPRHSFDCGPRSTFSMRLLYLVIFVLSTLSVSFAGNMKKAHELSSRDHDPLIQKVQPMKGGKANWPDLVGKTLEEAESIIKADRPDLSLHALPKDAMVTADFRDTRVRLFVDENKIVARTPVIG